MQTKFECSLFALRLIEREAGDKHIAFQLGLIDGDWLEPFGQPLSSHWISEMIYILEKARDAMEEDAKKTKYGYEFK